MFSGQKKLSEPVVGSSESIPLIPSLFYVTVIIYRIVLVEGTINSRNLEAFSVVRIPSVELTKSKEQSSVCILRRSAHTTITNTPGFYTPLAPPLASTDVVFTKMTPNMGIGLFAKRSVKIGQVVFSERPLLVFPRGLPIYGPSREEAIKIQELTFEKELRRALDVMTKEEVDAYLGLSNCLPQSPQLYGIARTNAFSTDIEEQNLEEGMCEYAAVGNLASRINHRYVILSLKFSNGSLKIALFSSCMPNVHVGFDIPTFSLRVVPMQNIKAGEQLFYCYCQVNRSVKERQRQLAAYGFVCQCKACVNATPESDRLREEVEYRLCKTIGGIEEMFANPRFGIRSLDPLLELEKDIVKEGLDFGQTFVNLLSIILRAYDKIGVTAKEIEYFNKVNRYTGH